MAMSIGLHVALFTIVAGMIVGHARHRPTRLAWPPAVECVAVSALLAALIAVALRRVVLIAIDFEEWRSVLVACAVGVAIVSVWMTVRIRHEAGGRRAADAGGRLCRRLPDRSRRATDAAAGGLGCHAPEIGRDGHLGDPGRIGGQRPGRRQGPPPDHDASGRRRGGLGGTRRHRGAGAAPHNEANRVPSMWRWPYSGTPPSIRRCACCWIWRAPR